MTSKGVRLKVGVFRYHNYYVDFLSKPCQSVYIRKKRNSKMYVYKMKDSGLFLVLLFKIVFIIEVGVPIVKTEDTVSLTTKIRIP